MSKTQGSVLLAQPRYFADLGEGHSHCVGASGERWTHDLGLEGFEIESSVIHARIDLIFDASRRPEGTDPIQIVSDWSAEVWVDAFLSDDSSGGPTTTKPNRSG